MFTYPLGSWCIARWWSLADLARELGVDVGSSWMVSLFSLSYAWSGDLRKKKWGNLLADYLIH